MKRILLLLLLTVSVADAQFYTFFEEGFEEGETHPDWQVLDLDGDTFSFEIVYTSDVTDALGFEPGRMAGSFGIKFPLSGADPYSITPNDVLISPTIINHAEFGQKLSFTVGNVVENNNSNTYSVYIFDADSDFDADTLTSIHTETLTGPPSARRREIDFEPTFDDQGLSNYKIAFRHYDSDGQFILLMDDISVGYYHLNTMDIDNNKNAIKIYPNPAKDEFSITSDLDIKTTKIYNVEGKLIEVIEGNIHNKKLNCYNIGTYFLTVEFENGTTTREMLLVE